MASRRGRGGTRGREKRGKAPRGGRTGNGLGEKDHMHATGESGGGECITRRTLRNAVEGEEGKDITQRAQWERLGKRIMRTPQGKAVAENASRGGR
jgi:hypothetical protein